MSKQRMVVEWSPHDESLFAVGADNLRLFESTCAETSTNSSDEQFDLSMTTRRKRSFRLIKINSHISQLKCMEWYPFDTKPYMIATGASSGKVMLSDFQDTRVRIVQEFLPKYSRPCNAVAWNKTIPTQIAAGFEKVRSDFCTLIWDINSSSAHHHLDGLHHHHHHLESGDEDPQTTGRASTIGGTLDPDKPIYELGNSEATVALSWVPLQPSCLATGTGFKWLRIYDLRAKITSPLSIVAHNKAVLGVVFDQHRPHMLATYTDGPQEVVKVWDIRRLDNTSGPVLSLHQTSKTLSQVSWCPSKPGILVTSSQEEKWVSLWDVSKPDGTPSTGAAGTQTGTTSSSNTSVLQVKKPFKRRYTSEPLTSFSWQYLPNLHQLGKDSITAAAFPNRLLTASIIGEIEDISVHDSMPICVSSHGSVTFSCGKLLFGGIAPEQEKLDSTEDVSKEMYRLAKQGYSVTLSKCLKIFHPRSQYDQLRALWHWVDQVEALRRIHANRIAQSKSGMGPGGGAPSGANSVAPGPLRGWPVDPNLLVIAGVKNLLGYSGDMNDLVTPGSLTSSILDTNIVTVARVDTIIGCNLFEGPGRRLALLACNWDPDCGQSAPVSTAGDFSNNMGMSTSRSNLTLHRSNSGAWSSQKQFEDSAPSFGNRSWNEASRHELRSVISRCESEGNFARAAALAVFHGDLQMGMAVLQRGAMLLSQSGSVYPPPPYSSDVLQLVAVAVAGYSSTAGPNAASMEGSSAGASLWATMCQQLLKRDEIISVEFPRYLYALLSFLYITCTSPSYSSSNPSASSGINSSRSNQQQGLRRNNTRRAWGSVDGLSVYSGTTPSTGTNTSGNIYFSILNDPTLRLSDRIAFACRYLPAEELKTYLTQHEDDCEQYGRLEGLILTGLDTKGLQLLQQHVDSTGDIQTAALLAARVPASYVNTQPQLGRWIVQYQDLLNQWQLFHQRARFDVGRTQLEDILNGFASLVNIGDLSSDELNAELNAPATLSIPPQLYVRCNFCNASLSLTSLLRLGGSHSSWLNRAKPKLTCCPSCRKSLPQCTLCLLPFGSLNPYFELAHRRSKQVAEAIASTSANNPSDSNTGHVEHELKSKQDESLSQFSSIPFIEWFTWCQSCKHGGHAHHIADWFKSHSKCPVTDCECHCQELDHTSLFQQEETRWLEQENRQQSAMNIRSPVHRKNGMRVPWGHTGGGRGMKSSKMKVNTHHHQQQQQHSTAQGYPYQGSIQKRTPLRSMSNVSLPGSLK